MRNAKSITLSKYRLLSFIRPVQNSIYNIFGPKGLKFLTRLRLGLSHPNAHGFRHNFQDCLNPLCCYSLKTEDTSRYLLHCYHFLNHCPHLMNSVKFACDNFESMSDNVKKNVSLNDSLDIFLIDKIINSVPPQKNHLLYIYIFIYLH